MWCEIKDNVVWEVWVLWVSEAVSYSGVWGWVLWVRVIGEWLTDAYLCIIEFCQAKIESIRLEIQVYFNWIPGLINSRSMWHNHISRRKLSLKNSIWLCRTRVFKTRDRCGIIVSNSSSMKRVFKPRILYRTRVSKTWDASLLKPFKRNLLYSIPLLC